MSASLSLPSEPSPLHFIRRNNRAVGVEYVGDALGRSKSDIQDILFVKAARLVVVSAGTFGSPAILERCYSSMLNARLLMFMFYKVGCRSG